jgi:hypothetical protein
MEFDCSVSRQQHIDVSGFDDITVFNGVKWFQKIFWRTGARALARFSIQTATG